MNSVIRNVMNVADVRDAVRANATPTVSQDTDLIAIRTRARVSVTINHYASIN